MKITKIYLKTEIFKFPVENCILIKEQTLLNEFIVYNILV